MSLGPIFREGIEVHFVEGHGFAAYFYFLILLAPAVFLALFLPSLDAQVWIGPAQLFKVAAVTAMVLIVYSSLRVANQEFAPWRFAGLRHWLVEEKVSAAEIARAHLTLLCLQALLLILLAAPLLFWSAAIARAPASATASVFLLIFFYALAYGIWGLAALALWERKLESRQVFVRALFISLVFLSAALYVPLNPIAFLWFYVADKEMAPLVVWGWRGNAIAVHFAFHLGLLAAGGLVYRRALRRERF
ncbi:MAG TPA: hypothetical protein VGL11_21425 [Candidatus Binatia bacterium]|jgi:hypothetical protein